MDGKITLFLFAALVAVCYAQTKCCVPDQFETLTGRIFGGVKGGVPQVMRIGEQTAFDYTNRRRAQIMDVSFQGNHYTSQNILDYKNEVQYTFEPESLNCHKRPLKGPMEHCLPDYAVYDGAIYIGDNQLLENVYSYPVNDNQYVGNITLTITKDGCIPVGGVFIGSASGMPTLETSGVANFTKGIKNPDRYFTVPDYCSEYFTENPSERITTRRMPF